MKRWYSIGVVLAIVALATPGVGADVKTREKTLVKFEGMLGGVVNLFGGSAARDGVTSTVAVKGSRMSTINQTTGQIIDLAEEKVYDVDVRRREYRVRTFAELRAEFEKAKAEAEKQARDLKPEEREQVEQAGRQFEFDVAVRETGEKKTMAGLPTRQVILTVTAHEKGRPVEESGGFVMTTDMWLAARIPALDEIAAFNLKFAQAIYGEALAMDLQQMAGLVAMFPSFKTMAERMEAEGRRLDGTPMLTTMTFETVRSAEQMKAAAAQQPAAGGGLGGALARRMMGNRGQPQQRTTTFTTTTERLSVETSATDADVAVPAGFRERR